MEALRELDLVILRHCEKAGDGLSDPDELAGWTVSVDGEEVAASTPV